MKKIFLKYFAVLNILFISCNNTSVQKEKNKNFTRNSNVSINDSCGFYLKKCKRMDSVLMNATASYNEKLAIEANNTFVKFALQCKNDSLTPMYLMKAAQLSESLKKLNLSEKYLQKIIDDYPQSKIIPAAKLLLAQYYADVNLLNQPTKAKVLLNEIIKDYPQTIWADNASAALKWVGKSDDEIIKELKKKNN